MNYCILLSFFVVFSSIVVTYKPYDRKTLVKRLNRREIKSSKEEIDQEEMILKEYIKEVLQENGALSKEDSTTEDDHKTKQRSHRFFEKGIDLNKANGEPVTIIAESQEPNDIVKNYEEDYEDQKWDIIGEKINNQTLSDPHPVSSEDSPDQTVPSFHLKKWKPDVGRTTYCRNGWCHFRIHPWRQGKPNYRQGLLRRRPMLSGLRPLQKPRK